MKRILFLILLFFLLVPFVSAQDNSTLEDSADFNEYYVSVDGNLGGNGSADNPFSDIRTAINRSSSGDIIYLNGGTYSGTDNTNLNVAFSNLTIKAVDGQKVIIDGNNTNRIFSISEDYFTVTGITFNNTFALQGSCFDIWSRHVSISDCTFINNRAASNGGAVFIRNNFLTVDNCTFINCSALTGGAMHLEGARIVVSNCNFIDCSAGQAGAINWHRKSSYLYNSTFINCHAFDNGGAMAVNENTVVFSNITAINCSAAKNGGVIFGTELKGSISNSKFINNSADAGSVFRTYFGCDFKLSNSTLLNNSASSTSIALNISKNDSCVDIIATFIAKNSLINAFNRPTESTVSFSNVSYWGINGLMNTGDVDDFVDGAEKSQNGTLIYSDNRQVNQPVTIEVYDSDNVLIKNITQNTGILGDASIKLDNLSYGDYTVKAYHNENEYYGYISNTETFSLDNDNIKIEGNDLEMYYMDGSKFVVNLTNANQPIVNASVKINLNGNNYTRRTNERGLASIAINLASGEYDVSAYYVDENNMTYVDNATINVKSTVYADDLVKIYKNDSQFYVNVTDFSGNSLANSTVTFNINGVFYNRTSNSQGIAKLNINLDYGNYTITSINTLNGEKISNLISVLPLITQNANLVKYYRNASQYVVYIIDGEGKPLCGENVTFNINGVFYTRTSNSTGHAKLNINLQEGKYTITAEYNGCRVSNNITVLPVLYADNLTKTYGSSDQFKVKLVDGVGNPLSGENISFNINGVFYDRITDGEGIGKLNINLQSGEYIITSSYNQSNIANRVTVI